MDYLLQQVINGLSIGVIYGLIAIGYSLVYGIIGMINFAHGDVYMVGAFHSLIAFLVLTTLLGITWIPLVLVMMLIVTVVLTSTYGWAIERIAYRPLRRSTRLAPLISAIGVAILLQNFVLIFQSPRNKPMHSVITGDLIIFQSERLAVRIGYTQIVIFVVTIALLIAFTLMALRTNFGRMQRACEQDMRMAALLGIDVDHVTSMTFVIGAALAAVGGLLVTLHYGIIDFYIGFLAGLKAFTAAVLGGIGSLPGAMLGGILLGLIEALWSAYFSIEYKDISAFAILIMVLIFRPSGLLGKPEIERT